MKKTLDDFLPKWHKKYEFTFKEILFAKIKYYWYLLTNK